VRFLDYMSTGPGRAIRIVIGLLMIGAGTAAGGPWLILAVAGLLPLATGVFNVCPISPLFGRSFRGNACRTR
jgi:membrane-associated protease RseP (regulator of RpoE activity)